MNDTTQIERVCKALKVDYDWMVANKNSLIPYTKSDLLVALKKGIKNQLFSKRRAILKNIEKVARERLGLSVAWPDLWLYLTVKDVLIACEKVLCGKENGDARTS